MKRSKRPSPLSPTVPADRAAHLPGRLWRMLAVFAVLVLAVATGCEQGTKDGESGESASTEEESEGEAKKAEGENDEKPTDDDEEARAAEAEDKEDGAISDDGTAAFVGGEIPAALRGRPKTFAEGTDEQRELLQKIAKALQGESLDQAAIFALALTDPKQPRSFEQAQGVFMLAAIYDTEGRQKKAIERIEALRDKFPPNPMIPATLAELYRATGDDDAALENLALALAVDPHRIDIMAQMAEIEAERGEAGAVEEIEKRYAAALETIEKELGDPETQKQRRLELVETLGGVRDPRTAKLLVAQLDSKDPETLGAVLDVIVSQGHTDAIPLMQKRIEAAPGSEVAAALTKVVAYMKEMPKSPEIPSMPPEIDDEEESE